MCQQGRFIYSLLKVVYGGLGKEINKKMLQLFVRFGFFFIVIIIKYNIIEGYICKYRYMIYLFRLLIFYQYKEFYFFKFDYLLIM